MNNEQVEQRLTDAGYIVDTGWFRGRHFVVTRLRGIVSVDDINKLFVGDDNVTCARNDYIYSVAVFIS